METPASLLERLRQPGEHAAWARLVELYTPLFFAWTRRLGLPAAEAADLVQDVFVILCRKLPVFVYDAHKGSLRSWLHKILVNRWREQSRRHAEKPLAPDAEAWQNVAAPDEVDALDEAEYRAHLVNRALTIMQADFQPTTWRACWELVVNGRPAADVAAELATTVDVVYAAKSRVLRRLREELAGLLD